MDVSNRRARLSATLACLVAAAGLVGACSSDNKKSSTASSSAAPTTTSSSSSSSTPDKTTFCRDVTTVDSALVVVSTNGVVHVLQLNDGQLDDIRRDAPDEMRSDAETFVKAAKAAASSNNPSDFEAGNVQEARSRMVSFCTNGTTTTSTSSQSGSGSSAPTSTGSSASTTTSTGSSTSSSTAAPN